MYTPSAPLSRRRFLQLVAATAAPLALAACVAPAPSGGGAAPAPDGEKVAVRYIAMDYDSRMQADTQEVIDAFNASQDKIEAALEVVRWADGANVIRTQMSAGQPPDIFNQGGGQLLEYHAADEVEALNDLMGEDFLANFWKSGIDAMSVDGKLWHALFSGPARAVLSLGPL